MGIETALILAAVGATGAGVASSISSSRAAKRTAATQAAPTPIPQVGDVEDTPADERQSAARRLGRQALISTSPSGVQTTAPTGRRKLLGN